ncbi:Esterase FE4 [Folsomia candida]|uniref:Esterase FE4 n=1 Tax=Folsomia candida TaxID=158441 RepID=A0A226ENI4_FOLCA|nr:Esterase FE4 [Folsomia candida]
MSYFKLIRLTFALLAAVLSATMYNIFIKKEPSPTVKVKGGEMRGIIMKSRGGRDFYGYLGIPFALPATGSLRFQSPVPFPAWEGVWDASFNRPMCAQFDFMVSQIKLGSEDCLYLNVYAPANLPVLVYIHGGYFHCGGTAFPGAHNFMDQNVVVVVLSYRLGALGLFSRAIRQSGSSLNYWTLYRNTKTQSQHFARKFNCPIGNSEQMVECLRSLDVTTLLEGHRGLSAYPIPLIERFVPSLETVKDEDAFITEEPLEIIKSGTFNKVPVMAGFCNDEGLLHSTVLWANQMKLDEVNDWFSWAPKAFHYDAARKDISQTLKDFYFGTNIKNLNSRDLIQNLTNLYGDRLFNVGICQTAHLENKHVPTYMYLYGHEGGFSMGALIAASQSKIHPIVGFIMERLRFLYVTSIMGEEYRHEVSGIGHADEYPLLWSTPLWGGRIEKALVFTDKDVEISKDLVQLWVDFAMDKSPLKFRDVIFTPSEEGKPLKFLHIKYNDPKMIDEPFQERKKLWESLTIPAQ